jgi:hypothetical protein
MANLIITRGTTLPDSSAKSDFHNLVDQATGTISNIVNADIDSAAAIADSKLAQITTADKVAITALTKASNLTTVTAVSSDYVVTSDTSDSGNTKKSLVSDIVTLAAYTPTAANALTGSVVQTVEGGTSSPVTITEDISDITAELTTTVTGEVTTKAITPTNASNLLRIDYEVTGTIGAASVGVVMGLFQDAGSNAINLVADDPRDANVPTTVKGTHWMTAGTTSSTTFKIRIGNSAAGGTFYVNANTSGTALFNGKTKARIIITEIKA